MDAETYAFCKAKFDTLSLRDILAAYETRSTALTPFENMAAFSRLVNLAYDDDVAPSDRVDAAELAGVYEAEIRQFLAEDPEKLALFDSALMANHYYTGISARCHEIASWVISGAYTPA